MKLEKNNKYNNLKAIGLGAVLLGGIILSGCGKESDIIKPTPTEIVEITPVPTSTSTEIVELPSTPMPTMKPNPVLTDDEVIETFGVVNGEEIINHNTVFAMVYETNEKNKISLVWIDIVPYEDGMCDIYDLFTNKVIFKIDYKVFESGYLSWDDSVFAAANENLGVPKSVDLLVLAQIKGYFNEKGIEISTSEYDDILNDMFDIGNSSMMEYAKMYSAVIPEEYWVTEEILNNKSDLVKVK